MKPETTGLIFTEFAVDYEALEGFRAFHSGEHVHERLAVPGVLGARRYVSVVEDNLFVALYRARVADVFLGPEYRLMGANPSEETKRQGRFINGTRFVGDIEAELGDSFAGYAYRVRVPCEPDADQDVVDWFVEAGPAMLKRPTIARALLARPRRGVDNVSDPNWMIFIEGSVQSAFETLQVPRGASTHVFRLEEMWFDKTV